MHIKNNYTVLDYVSMNFVIIYDYNVHACM